MFEPVKISPSVLSADFMNMERSIGVIEKGGADLIHVDVMDGHFVPNLTIGVPFVRQLKKIAGIPLDVHLMIDNPLVQLPWFIDAGADMLTVHIEALDAACKEPQRAIRMIHEAGLLCGLALKPSTPTSVLEPFIAEVDMVLVMSVNPGFSGQSYIEGTELRVAEVAAMATKAAATPLIQVDGGMDVATVGAVSAAGADVIVAGSAVFSEADPGHAIAAIAQSARDARLCGQGGTTHA